jgi:hypothetical protein
MEGDLFGCEDQLKFVKNSYLTVGSISKSCIRLLTPNKSNQPQPLFIADTRGILYVTEYKKGEPDVKVKTAPFPREITCTDLIQNINKEKIYFSFGNSIYITNRLCKDYSKIEFDLADNINSFRASDSLIWAVSNNCISKYEYGDTTVEKGCFDNEARITALCLSENFGKLNKVALIGSHDSKIKVINGLDFVYGVTTSSIPTWLSHYKSSYHDLSADKYVFGTNSGSHGLVTLLEKEAKILWEESGGTSEIVDIKTFDVNYDGVNEILCVHADGQVNIYATGKTILDLSLVSKYATGENLTGCDIGKFQSEEETEIILSSYSGLIFSLTPKVNLPETTKVQNVDKKSLTKGLKDVQGEIDLLKGLYEKRQADFQKQQTNIFNPVTKNPYKVDYKLTLQPKEAVYNLILESEFPIEIILMQSESVSLDIIEILTKDVHFNIIKDSKEEIIEKEYSMSSLMNNFNSQNQKINDTTNFLCTFRMKESVHCLSLLLRTYENVSDIINCTFLPCNKPKTAITIEIPIKALSLHKKEEDPKEIEEAFTDENVLNIMIIKGKFQAGEINQILSSIIPDIPEKTNKESMKYYLKSTFLKTMLEISIESNYCRIRSVYLSPLILIKEGVTKIANNRKRDMEFSVQIKTLSIFKILEKLHPLIQENYNIETEFKLLQAFKEIESDYKCRELPEEYKLLINQADSIRKKHEQRSINLHYHKTLVVNLLKDVSKVRNISDLHGNIRQLNDVFDDYSFDKLVEVFKELKNI